MTLPQQIILVGLVIAVIALLVTVAFQQRTIKDLLSTTHTHTSAIGALTKSLEETAGALDNVSDYLEVDLEEKEKSNEEHSQPAHG